MPRPKRIPLAHVPTPILPVPRLSALIGGASPGLEVFVKRDDMTSGPETGNKIRKLEFLFFGAMAEGADTVVTCGGIQSNHARATAIVAAQLGLRAVLLLRTTGDLDPGRAPLTGNVLLDRMVGAEIRLITPAQYRERAALMAEVARELAAQGRRAYVIPEGGSNGLGSLGYVRAMEEVRRQIDHGLGGGRRFDVVVHACGSGGTAAGVAIGAASADVAREVWAIAVCDDVAYFEGVAERIVAEARALDEALPAPVKLTIDDRSKGPAYAVASDAQKRLIVDAARATGLLFDPVYTGKAFFALVEAARRGELAGKRVLFLHTGGLPGLLAQGEDLSAALSDM